MRFIDQVEVEVVAGDGGSGAVSWRREKFIPRGGPDGGDGGDGGVVIFQTEPGLNTLIDFSFNPIIKAEDGSPGEANGREGKRGENEIRLIPVGTQVFHNERLVADLSTPGARWIAARGGQGGRGNAFFKTATRQSPDFAQPGTPGEKFRLRLVLKSVADVGLVGLPNTGKSTFISKTTQAHPKIADYPFTTLVPHLGVVLVSDSKRFVLADIPGLIPGAHQGKGLGLEFLRHIERTKVLLQLLDLSALSPESASDGPLREETLRQFEVIDNELAQFSETVHQLPRVVSISKIDLELNRRAFELTQEEFDRRGIELHAISSHTGEGIKELVNRLYMLSAK